MPAMFDRTAELHVACSPEQAFDHIARGFFENHPRWDPGIAELTQTSPGPIGAGTTGREVRLAGGGRFVTDFRIARFEPARAFAHVSTAGPMGEDVEYAIEPSGTGSILRIHLHIYAKTFLLRLLTPLIRPQIEKNYRANSARFERMLNELGVSGVPRG
jgi:polyketide cyclase/dehydrase/lipid transport protein